VLDALPASVQAAAKRALREIWDTEDRAHAERALDAFARDFAKWPKAVAKLTKEREAVLAFYDFPAEHWIHLRTSNPIESTFSPVRARTDVTKGPGLWWADDMAEFSQERKGDWSWTMMIAQPDEATPERFEAARVDVARKKNLPALLKARLERFEEGPCAQVLYLGPFSDEGPTIARLHAFIRERGYSFEGSRQKHHEIYLSDPRRSPPEKWRTIIRQPFAEE